MTDYHQPVLLKESVDALQIHPRGLYVDVTFGGGGHSREMVGRLEAGGCLYAFAAVFAFEGSGSGGWHPGRSRGILPSV